MPDLLVRYHQLHCQNHLLQKVNEWFKCDKSYTTISGSYSSTSYKVELQLHYQLQTRFFTMIMLPCLLIILWFHTDRATITKVYARRGRKGYGGSVHRCNEDRMGNITNIQVNRLQHNRMLRWHVRGRKRKQASFWENADPLSSSLPLHFYLFLIWKWMNSNSNGNNLFFCSTQQPVE